MVYNSVHRLKTESTRSRSTRNRKIKREHYHDGITWLGKPWLFIYEITLSLFGTFSQWSLGKGELTEDATLHLSESSQVCITVSKPLKGWKPTIQKMEASNCSVQIKTLNVCNARQIGCSCLKFQQICLWMLVRQWWKLMKSMFHHMVQELPLPSSTFDWGWWYYWCASSRWVYLYHLCHACR